MLSNASNKPKICFLNSNFFSNSNRLGFAGKVSRKLDHNKVLKTFTDEITPIYRESGYCENISNYLKQELQKEGFEIFQQPDGAGKGNIIAERNVKNNNAIILQAHMDMVYVSDYSDDELAQIIQGKRLPIELEQNKATLKAKHSSLGADDGIGVAMALEVARIKDPEIRNIPLQIIFTVDEEPGLIGAVDLPKNCLKGDYLVGLDIESLGSIVNGSSGITDFGVNEDFSTDTLGNIDNNKEYSKLSFEINGAKGGHSGLKIAKGKKNNGQINPIMSTFELLNELKDDVIIIDADGGEKINSIPTSMKVNLAVPSDKKEAINSKISAFIERTKEEHEKTDPDLDIQVSTGGILEKNTRVLDPKFQNKFIEVFADNFNNGVISFGENSKKVITSQSIGVLSLNDGKFCLEARIRSRDELQQKREINLDKKLFESLLNKEVKPVRNVPPWTPQENELTALALETYKEIGINKAQVKSTRGTIEGAVFQKFKPDLKQIGVGPTVKALHSKAETLNTSTLVPACRFLENLINKVHKQFIKPAGENKDLIA